MQGVALLDVLDPLYAAALDEARWPDALAALNRAFAGSGTTLEVHAGDDSLEFFQQVDLPSDGIGKYTTYYHRVCPRLPFLRSLGAGRPACDAMHISEAGMDRSEFYADFLAPDNLRYFVGGTLFNCDHSFGILAVHRTPRRGQASDAEVRTMGDLLPHIRNAVRISHRLRSASRRERELRAMLERLRFGAALVDRRGRVQYLNVAARTLLDGSGPLKLHDRELAAVARGDRARLRRVLATAIGSSGGPPLTGACAVGATHAEGPVSVLALPVPGGRSRHPLLDAGQEDDAVALVLVTRDHRLRADAAGIVAAMHDLTPAETRLALALVAGSSVQQHAESVGIKLSTARTHLLNLRSKLGVRTQVQAVAKLLAAIPPVVL